MVYDGIIGIENEEKSFIHRKPYRQHADVHEHWLSAPSRPDTRKAQRHAPVVKRGKFSAIIDSNFNATVFIDTLLARILFASSRFPSPRRRTIGSARRR